MSSNHLCHANRCTTPVPPKMLMCPKHWIMVPQELKKEVWAYYRPGQERDKQPSKLWMRAAKNAIEYVQKKELEEVLEQIQREGNGDKHLSFPVMSACCNQCLTTPGRIVSGESMKDIVDTCIKKETWFQCHYGTIVGEEVCCRGFFDAFGDQVAIIRLAKLYNLVEEKDVEAYQARVEELIGEGGEPEGKKEKKSQPKRKK